MRQAYDPTLRTLISIAFGVVHKEGNARHLNQHTFHRPKQPAGLSLCQRMGLSLRASVAVVSAGKSEPVPMCHPGWS